MATAARVCCGGEWCRANCSVRESTMGGRKNDGRDSTHATLAQRGIPRLVAARCHGRRTPTGMMKKYSCYNDGTMRERKHLMETQEMGLECCTLRSSGTVSLCKVDYLHTSRDHAELTQTPPTDPERKAFLITSRFYAAFVVCLLRILRRGFCSASKKSD